jgi:hypothetical protein
MRGGGVSERKGWDLTSPRSLSAAAEWVSDKSGALLVLVVRAENMAFAVDAGIAPADAVTMVEVRLEEMAQLCRSSRRLNERWRSKRPLGAGRRV